MNRAARIALLASELFVAVTALAGGVTLILGSIDPSLGTLLVPPAGYLTDSPFSSYAVPGVILIVFVAGVHAAAFWMGSARSRWFPLTSAVAGFGCAIWIFVQMIFIPFSALQALYFTLGVAELGLTMVLLGVLSVPPAASRATTASHRSGRGPSPPLPAGSSEWNVPGA